ncbi:DUF1826 domain-containing protein [Methylosinus sp. H3A]|uniref:DUF1826 domain-containing protein n=1 Tax=Methylosinus sp. H3A TaxID=2785786 RepID=UPI0018C33587|nr:DUF1826 domain-containing protein [Methylosinus sp. H3A]MBG0811536.1 DUF1826 domain-containing protein [Methylosinus sp. H3A]
MLRDEAAAPVSRRAPRNLMQSRSICLIPRELEPGVAAALDATTLASPLRLRVTGEEETLRRALAQGLADAGLEPAWLAEWLVSDVMRLALLYREATRAGEIRVRLETIADDACRLFHVDFVRFRLVTTYRGPGTQWIAPAPGADPLAEEPIRRLERGWVAILRGEKAATAEAPAQPHRSPPIAGTGVERLFLAIDEAPSASR